MPGDELARLLPGDVSEVQHLSVARAAVPPVVRRDHGACDVWASRHHLQPDGTLFGYVEVPDSLAEATALRRTLAG